MFKQKAHSPKELDHLLTRLVTDKRTRQDIKEEVKRLRAIQNTTTSAVDSWDAHASLQILCWKYC